MPLLVMMKSMKLKSHFPALTGALYMMVSVAGRSRQAFSVHPISWTLGKPQIPYNIQNLLVGSVSQVPQLAHCCGDMLGGAANRAT